MTDLCRKVQSEIESIMYYRALEEGGQGFGIQTPKRTKDSRFIFQTGQDLGSKFHVSHTCVYIRFRWYSPVAVQYSFNICLACYHKVGIQISKWIFRIHHIFEGGIQDSNLKPRKMAGIQDSNLVFKGPTNNRPGCHLVDDLYQIALGIRLQHPSVPLCLLIFSDGNL